jgi:hypothetical protein
MIGPAILSLHERANSRKDMADTYEKDRAFSLDKMEEGILPEWLASSS